MLDPPIPNSRRRRERLDEIKSFSAFVYESQGIQRFDLDEVTRRWEVEEPRERASGGDPREPTSETLFISIDAIQCPRTVFVSGKVTLKSW
jgi:hypothetical protein